MLLKQNKLYIVASGMILVILTSIVLALVRTLLFPGTLGNVTDVNARIELDLFMVIFPLLLSPIIEELIFRKWLPGTFRDVLGKKKSVLFSNLLFTFFHFDLFFIPYLANGLIYSWYYEKTQDIKVSIAIHILYNIFVFVGTNI